MKIRMIAFMVLVSSSAFAANSKTFSVRSRGIENAMQAVLPDGTLCRDANVTCEHGIGTYFWEGCNGKSYEFNSEFQCRRIQKYLTSDTTHVLYLETTESSERLPGWGEVIKVTKDF